MKNAIAIIVGAVIISATVSVVQGQSIFGKGICKNPVGLSENRFMCDAKIYTYQLWADGVPSRFVVVDLEHGDWEYMVLERAADSP